MLIIYLHLVNSFEYNDDIKHGIWTTYRIAETALKLL